MMSEIQLSVPSSVVARSTMIRSSRMNIGRPKLLTYAANRRVTTNAMPSCATSANVGTPRMTRIWLSPATRKKHTTKQLPAPNSRSMS